jgi:hypothetical protein
MIVRSGDTKSSVVGRLKQKMGRVPGHGKHLKVFKITYIQSVKRNNGMNYGKI